MTTRSSSNTPPDSSPQGSSSSDTSTQDPVVRDSAVMDSAAKGSATGGRDTAAAKPAQGRGRGAAKKPRGLVWVLSCGTGPLPQDVINACAGMDIVFGSATLLKQLEEQIPEAAAETGAGLRSGTRPEAEKGPEFVILSGSSVPGKVEELLDRALHKGRRVALLSSGDGLFHGLGGTLVRVARENGAFAPDRDAGMREMEALVVDARAAGHLPGDGPEDDGEDGDVRIPDHSPSPPVFRLPRPFAAATPDFLKAYDLPLGLRHDLPVDLRFTPGITSFQNLFARLGLPWSEATFFSVHSTGDCPRPLVRRILKAKLAVILTGSPVTASVVASMLCSEEERIPPTPNVRQRPCVLGELLGTERERIVATTLGELALLGEDVSSTSVLVLLPVDRPDTGFDLTKHNLPLGLADECYTFENHLITNRRLRPVVLSCLDLPPSGVLWDLGSGSGSVGIEAALLRPDLEVHAVEKNPDRHAATVENARRLGAINLVAHLGDILEGSYPGYPSGLPDPDRVFVGGGGRDLPNILDRSLERLARRAQFGSPDTGEQGSGGPRLPDAHTHPRGLLVATAVSLESVVLLAAYTGGRCVETLSVDLAVRRPMRGTDRDKDPSPGEPGEPRARGTSDLPENASHTNTGERPDSLAVVQSGAESDAKSDSMSGAMSGAKSESGERSVDRFSPTLLAPSNRVHIFVFEPR